jgi:transposase-like protein
MKTEIEFPKTLQAAIKHFADPDVALNFMASIRWPNGVKCPRCGSDKVSFTAKRRVWTCECCPNRRQFSIKVGTIMEDSPITLDKWLAGIWLIVSAKNGISSYETGRALGLTQKSAWFLGHRVRLALQNGTFEKLSGEIEADETYIGGKVRNMHADRKRKRGRGTGGVGKAIVMGLLERSKAKASTVKLKHVPTAPETVSSKKIEAEFNLIADRWETETAIHSSPGGMYLNKDYIAIIAKGVERPEVYVPLILNRLSVRGGDWFFALENIAGENPAKDCEDYENALIAWRDWATQRGFIKESNAVLAA